jgi:hypothetical protein
MIDSCKGEAETFSTLNGNPSNLYQSVRALKRSNTYINKLHVHSKIYEGDNVCDGFYDSIAFLKTEAHQNLEESDSYCSANEEYSNIIRICKQGPKVPKMSIEQTEKILKSIRPAVSDFSYITGYHYRYSGATGLCHLNELLNALIDNINKMCVEEQSFFTKATTKRRHKQKTLEQSRPAHTYAKHLIVM